MAYAKVEFSRPPRNNAGTFLPFLRRGSFRHTRKVFFILGRGLFSIFFTIIFCNFLKSLVGNFPCDFLDDLMGETKIKMSLHALHTIEGITRSKLMSNPTLASPNNPLLLVMPLIDRIIMHYTSLVYLLLGVCDNVHLVLYHGLV